MSSIPSENLGILANSYITHPDYRNLAKYR
jgi:hypothetical protein